MATELRHSCAAKRGVLQRDWQLSTGAACTVLAERVAGLEAVAAAAPLPRTATKSLGRTPPSAHSSTSGTPRAYSPTPLGEQRGQGVLEARQAVQLRELYSSQVDAARRLVS